MMTDLIRRQDAIDAVEFGITYAKAFSVNTGESNELFKEGNDALKKAVERLKELPSAQSVQRWIPCSEKLPEKGKVVLITNEKGNVRCGQYRGVWSFYERPTEWVWRGNTVETVIPWRYLPEPYKAESEDKE